jgi:hypothetical protein
MKHPLVPITPTVVGFVSNVDFKGNPLKWSGFKCQKGVVVNQGLKRSIPGFYCQQIQLQPTIQYNKD